MKNKILFLAVLLTGALLSGCNNSKSNGLQASIDTGNVSTFDPANGIVPYPTDLLFQGSTNGNLNIPIPSGTPKSDPRYALNALDGFSTNAPITTGFDAAIDPTSIGASSVRIFEVNPGGEYPSAPGGAIVSIAGELTYGTDFVAKVSSFDPKQLVIVPLKPLKPSTSYEVVITSSLHDMQGNAMLPSPTYALAKSTTPYYTLPSGPRAANLPAGLAGYSDAQLAGLEGLREMISTSEATTASSTGGTLSTSDIILSWGFTTQSIDTVLKNVLTYDDGLPTSYGAISLSSGGFNSTSPPVGTAGFDPAVIPVPTVKLATIHVGYLQVPYFLTAPTSTTDTASLYKHWMAAGNTELSPLDETPVPTSTQTIPVLVSIPPLSLGGPCGSVAPLAGWPVVIFQHGITRNRTDMLAVADDLAADCIAAVAIDLPLHGLTGNETDGTQAFYQLGGIKERTFNLDVLTQDSSGNVIAYTGDGVTDTSGSNFINLSNLLETRDNLRQGISDLFVLVNNIKNGALQDGAGDTFDSSKIFFLGHSLGAIVGTPFIALESTNVQAAVLANGGAGVAKILDGSATFGPVIAAGLAANGIDKGTSDYESFLGAAQTVMDSADPVNYSLNASGYAPSAAAGRGLLFFEDVGDPANSIPSDLVVPNTVPDSNDTSGMTIPAPLAGTEPQLKLLGLTQLNPSSTSPLSGANLLVSVKFTAGDHGSLLDPASSPAVTGEMQSELASFFGPSGATNGSSLSFNNSSGVIQTP